MENKQFISTKQFICTLSVLFSLLAGFFVRYDAQFSTLPATDNHFKQQTPAINNIDGYWYLALCDDLLNGTYKKIDEKRGIPDTPSTRPIPPPLLTVILAILANILPFSLDWIAMFLPTVLGFSLAIPLYLFGNSIGGKSMALPAIAIGLISYAFAERSSIGYLDTDCLNLTFPLISAYCFMRFGLCSASQRYFYLLGGCITSLLFIWWWVPVEAALISLSPLIIALAFFYRARGRERIFFSFALFAGCIVFISFIGLKELLKIFSHITEQFFYISKLSSPDSYNIGNSIGEQSAVSLSDLVQYTTTNSVVFLLSVAGLLLLVFLKWRQLIFLVPTVIIGFLGVVYAQRFLMFLTPIMALGFGFSCSLLYRFIKLKNLTLTVIASIILFTSWQSTIQNTFKQPFYSAKTIEGMQQLRNLTPADAVIWSWWDEGYPIIYWGKRGTINDGMIHGGEVSRFCAIPMASDDFRFSANFMVFYASRGISGIHYFANSLNLTQIESEQVLLKILKVGPTEALHLLRTLPFNEISKNKSAEEWLEFFYPSNPKPVYLFLNERLVKNSPWIYFQATWDAEKQSGEKTLPLFLFDIAEFPRKDFLNKKIGDIDFGKGTIQVGAIAQPVNLKKITITDQDKSQTIEYRKSKNASSALHVFQKLTDEYFKSLGITTDIGTYELDISTTNHLAILHDTKCAEMLVKQLFWRKSTYNNVNFKPILLHEPDFQIWEIVGDNNKYIPLY